MEALSFLEELKSERVSEFREGCQKKMPLSTVFLTTEQLADLQKQNKQINGVPEANEEVANGDALLIEPSGEQQEA
jgi:hypothetical protein